MCFIYYIQIKNVSFSKELEGIWVKFLFFTKNNLDGVTEKILREIEFCTLTLHWFIPALVI